MPEHVVQRGILVGVDGSANSDAAVRWAAQEAAMRNVPLTVVHVASPLVGGWSAWEFAAAPPPEGFVEWQEAEANGVVADAARVAERSTADHRPLRISPDVVFAQVVPTLVDLTKEAQMIAVGRQGQGAFSSALLGSVSNALVHHAHCPVAVIHEDTGPAQSNAPVLVGVDGSTASELATAIAFEEAAFRGVDLVVLHSWSDHELSDFPGLPWSEMSATAHQTLVERLAGWQERYPEITVQLVVVEDKPARHLVERSTSAQLVVVGSHGRGGFAGMHLGSVSTAVVHAVRAPVIVARQG